MTQLLIDLNRKYTSAEFARLDLPDDGHYELVEGRVVTAPSTSDKHNSLGLELYSVLRAYVRPKQLGKLWVDTDFEFNENNTRAPDIAFMITDRVPAESDSSVPIVPDLAVEIWSNSDLDTKNHRQDARDKIQLYQNSGVQLIWAINPRSKTVYVYHPDTTDNPIELTGNDELDGENIIPGFRLSLKTLFEMTFY